MNSKTQHFLSTATQACFALILAGIAFKMTTFLFAAPIILFEKMLPEWVQSSLLVLGISLGLLSGYKCFSWSFSHFRKNKIFYFQ